ncbi:Glycosyltransferase involved in cell wall bisynthesis [Bosea sp. 62]|uniref:glycosyltransferase family 4 protein n=1 Tax=unclassified Bosea (in: a-proteobacteria) TaxID=2653178 RepID=UPI00125AC196|nr:MULTISPECIES: glycosyltransferase family 4 protein [unclassified Bosea (in: a-proteobacteria)]CAD5252394.1 Glycosyltransferase involved in cell wall bisynthesis [Bosea sp. 7B]CAD5279084.1 Glycosyltransferase involved in cell wall bisynthesis [Bosea sp. 21B]CAD5280205.1 Glycosyltransferase involved in cell wall bisynthesis [Bosea sp. 46]VVT59580.1 Glycosyltransferase involved in cell wall bisynthesis [Bosea sp. EC-HK365B]VXB34817.1 Glycosyltransferase involved in cell wall bisynthesis [Bosea
MSSEEPAGPAIAIAMKGYPRLSETFIAQELLGLQRLGLPFAIWSLRHPTDGARHMMHREITAPLHYLPEYLHDDWPRVLRGIIDALARPSILRLLGVFVRDFSRDRTRNRLRRFGQACVMARELPASTRHLHVHYLHTPASVIRYAALSRGLSWSFSAHAKDIWTTPNWEKREKITDARWGVTCTRDGHAELARLADRPDTVALLYHGLDLARFPVPPEARPPRDGSDPAEPVRFITIGRAVAKKGFDDLLAALAILPAELNWRLVHIGGGEMLAALKAQAEKLGLASRIEWRGAQAQDAVVAALREADLFVLPSKQAGNGDRDGLPNVVMEAASQALPIVATDFAGIPEFVEHGREGLLLRPSDVTALAKALDGLARDPQWRGKLGAAAFDRLSTEFSAQAGLERVHRALLAAVAGKDDGAP